METERTATIEIHRESLHFSVAHFTIFSATKRENLHGHNYFVKATVSGPVGDDGLCFDYNIVKRILQSLCDELDETTLLPEFSPYLQLADEGDHFTATFNDTEMRFLRRDVQTLPLRNITVEELAAYLLDRLTSVEEFVNLPVEHVDLSIESGPGQTAMCTWRSES